jgi:4-aminobutyrate aminotransferase-like enzyme
VLIDRLRGVAERHPSVANVRGRGLLVGFDLVEPRSSTLRGATLMRTERCAALFEDCLANGLILMAYTPRVRINPPLVFSADEAARAVSILDGALENLERA